MLPPFPHPPAGLAHARPVSIVITNRDYADYLPAALDSALGQRGTDVEVIVVDDGSADASREILARYADRIRVLLLDGRGQKAAFNAGFAAASGDVVVFLDADDELRPGTAAAAAAACLAQPGTARVVFRLEVVDAAGVPTGACVPPAGTALAAGDVRPAVLAFPDDLAWPPTSGNAFAAWALRRVFPIPLDHDDERSGADMYLHPLIPLLGPVVALEQVGGSYRMHGSNAHARDELDVQRSRFILRSALHAHRRLDRLARELGYGPARPRSVTIAAHRIISLRLGGPGHPVRADSRRRALGAGLRAALGRTDVGAGRRAAYAVWFVLAAAGPAVAVRPLAAAFLQPLNPGALVRRLRAPWATGLTALVLLAPTTAYVAYLPVLRSERDVYPPGWVSPRAVVERLRSEPRLVRPRPRRPDRREGLSVGADTRAGRAVRSACAGSADRALLQRPPAQRPADSPRRDGRVGRPRPRPGPMAGGTLTVRRCPTG